MPIGKAVYGFPGYVRQYIIDMTPLYDTYVMFSIGNLTAFSAICCVDHRNYRQKIFLVVTFFFKLVCGGYGRYSL